MEFQMIYDDVLGSYVIVSEALKDYVKVTTMWLRRLGKRCTDKWVYKQCRPAIDIKYLNFLAVFKLWIAAMILSGNIAGAERILSHVTFFVARIKKIAIDRTEFPIMSEPEKHGLLTKIIAELKLFESMTFHDGVTR